MDHLQRQTGEQTKHGSLKTLQESRRQQNQHFYAKFAVGFIVALRL